VPRSSGSPSRGEQRQPAWRRALQITIGIALVGGIFAGVIPKVAAYSDVGRVLTRVGPWPLAALIGIAAFNVVTYWPQMMAAMPGLTFAQAAVNNQTTTAIANTIPGGGALAVGVAYTMFRSWGFTTAEIALLTGTTGIWNSLIKFAMPGVALVILSATGGVSGKLLMASLIGVGALVVSLVLLLLALWRASFARTVGRVLGRLLQPVRRLLRKRPVRWEEAAATFRSQTIDLLRRRWVALTVTTLVSHVSLYLVLLASLRAVGVGASDVSWAEALGVFAFARLVSSFPLTPGGLGVVELSYIGGLVLAGGAKPEVVAAVLLFRALTFGAQIPLGPVGYVVWRRRASWRRRRVKRSRLNPAPASRRVAGRRSPAVARSGPG
jgi:uncharacterized protein (TIRG00374 family)